MKPKQQFIRALPNSLYLKLRWTSQKIHYGADYPIRQDERTLVSRNGYTLKPFDETKSIFIHIPKCAGISISKMIYGNLAGGHTTLEEYLDIFRPHDIQNYFIFTVVRNPWDRIVSAFHFLKSGGLSDRDRAWTKENIAQYRDFSTFCEHWLNEENILKYHHFRPQYQYFLDRNKKIRPDFICFFENLDADIQYVCEKLKITNNLKKNNTSQHKPYQSYYNERSMKIVEDVYKEDIKILGYNFTNSNIHKQIELRNQEIRT